MKMLTILEILHHLGQIEVLDEENKDIIFEQLPSSSEDRVKFMGEMTIFQKKIWVVLRRLRISVKEILLIIKSNNYKLAYIETDHWRFLLESWQQQINIFERLLFEDIKDVFGRHFQPDEIRILDGFVVVYVTRREKVTLAFSIYS